MEYKLTRAPVAETGMLIRVPAAEAFEAVVDPAVTTRFWFTRSSGRLEPGKWVRWDWEMYGASAQVRVVEIEPNARIRMEWGDPEAGLSTVEWVFQARTEQTTFVTVRETGFGGDGDAALAQALDSTGGFTLVLAAMKALLEHNIVLKVVADRHPDHWQ